MNLILLCASLCALSYLALSARPTSRLRSVIKLASVALLALAVAVAQGPVLLVVALTFCAMGDLALSRDGEGAFMAGIGAFAAGHLAYVALFLTHPLAEPARLIGAPQAWVAIGFVLLGIVMAAILGPRAGALRGPVLGYVPIILGMGIAVLVLPGQGALRLALPAAIGFVVSDLVLAVDTFLLRRDHPAKAWAPHAVWVTYWGAQAGFVAAFTGLLA